MKLGKISLGLAAVALAATPVFAQAVLAPAVAPLTGAESEQAEEGSDTSLYIIGALGAAAVIVAVVAVSGGDESPTSP